MIIGFQESNSFEISVMDLMDMLKDRIESVEDLEQFSTELHESIETAITDMLMDGYNGINPDDYDPQF